jgi:plastocyanin
MRKIWLSLVALCLAVTVSACGGASTSTTETTQSGATITIADMSFGEPVTVAPGATITIKNQDSVEHSVTSKTEGKFSVDVDGKEQGTLTAPTAPGTYAFYCKYHPSMNGTLIVK